MAEAFQAVSYTHLYDNNWTHLNLKRPGVSNSKRTHKKPDRFEEMLLISKELSKNYPFLRVDFYVTENSIYIGELTLYPASGFDGFEPEAVSYTHLDVYKRHLQSQGLVDWLRLMDEMQYHGKIRLTGI